jgi:hypothetical protein
VTAPEELTPAENAKRAVERDLYGRLALRRLSEVRSRSVKFIVPGYIPCGAFVLLSGVGGLGKSMWAAWLAAGETRGDYGGEPHDVIYISFEDSAEEIWRPRILAAGGDPERVIEVRVDLDDGGVVVLPDDLDSLERVIRINGVRLVIIDPVIASFDLSLDTFKDQHVRAILGKLGKVAEDTGCAFVGIGHLNKAPTTEAYLRVANSVAFYNAARSVILITEEDDDHRLVSQVKANWARGSSVQRWKIEPIVLPSEIDPTTGKPVESSKMTFVEIAEGIEAHEALEHRERGEQLTEALAFLARALRDGEWHESKPLKVDAEALGISERTLKRAAKELGFEYEQQGFPMTTVWRLPSLSDDDQAKPTKPTWPNRRGESGQAHLTSVAQPETTIGPRPLSPLSGPIGEPASDAASRGVGATIGPRGQGTGAAGPTAEPGRLGQDSDISGPTVGAGPSGVTPPDCDHPRVWVARDGVRRCLTCEPPASPGEVVSEEWVRPLVVVGDDGYLGLLDRAHANGHVTDQERRERRKLHFTLRRLNGGQQ